MTMAYDSQRKDLKIPYVDNGPQKTTKRFILRLDLCYYSEDSVWITTGT